MKKLLSVILAVCLVLSVVVFANAEYVPDTTVHQALTSMIDESSSPPPSIEKFERFSYQVFDAHQSKYIQLVGFDPDNSNVGGVINPDADNSYDSYYHGGITIPDTIDGIKVVNFSSSFFEPITNSLSHIHLPQSANLLHGIKTVSSLVQITISDDAAHYAAIDGVLFSKDKTELLIYPPAKGGHYTVPDSVEIISFDAFNNSTVLCSITLPENLFEIKARAFQGCSALQEIEIPDSITTINNSTFLNCTSLERIKLPSNLLYVGELAFANTPFHEAREYEDCGYYLGDILVAVHAGASEIAVREGTRIIAAKAAYKNTTLTKVTLPNTVVSINSYAFSGCTNLTDMTVPMSVTHLYEYSLYCPIKEFPLYDTIDFLGSNCLPYYFFDKPADEDGFVYNGKHLIKCTKPYDTKIIFIKQGTKTIYHDAFYGFYNLREVIIPEGVTGIARYAFSHSEIIQYLHIPDSLKYIEGSPVLHTRFVECVGKKDTTAYKTLVRTIDICGYMHITELDDGTIRIDQLDSKELTRNGLLSPSVPNEIKGKAVTKIGKDTFEGYVDATHIYLGEHLNEIHPDALANHKHAVLHAYYGSYAEQFAKDNNFNLVKMYWYGDLSGDFEIKAEDALLVLHASVEKIALNQDESILADVDDDGDTTASEALAILQMAVGKIKEF